LDRDGVFAEYALIPENVVWKNDPSIPPKLASIQEPLGNSVHALGNVAGCSVAIFGAGTTGLFATALAYIEGATSIYVIDQYEFRLDLAKTLGATSTINFRNVDVVSFILKATNGLGVDVALEMSGSPLALSQALKIARSGGRVVAFGIPSRPVKIDLSDVIFKEIKIGGITGRKIFETWYKTSSFLISGKLDISAVITHELPLDEFERGFDLLMNHPDRAVKVVLYP
jgi:threonine 3-dehydrogenase